MNAIKVYESQDAEVRLFNKIIKHECDEDFHLVQKNAKDTILLLLRQAILDKNKYTSESTLDAKVESIQQGTIEPWLWHYVIENMFDE